MNKKKILSLVLALAVVASLCVPALAADGTADFEMVKTGEGDQQVISKDSANANTVLEGTIAATQLKCTVTTNVQFTIDPTLTPSTDAVKDPESTENYAKKGQFGQINQPEIVISNESLVPVYAKVTSVSVGTLNESQQKTNIVNLVNTPANLINTKLSEDGNVTDNKEYKEKSMMFALGDLTVEKDYNQPLHWLTEGAVKGDYWLSDNENGAGRIEAGKLVATKDDNGNATTKSEPSTMNLRIYGQVQMGWHAEDTFTITPTIVVTCVKPEAKVSVVLPSDEA